MNFGYLDNGDTLITTRLILGMITSATQQPKASAGEIANAVAALLRVEPGSSQSV
jgi:hypothetical protein